MAALCYRARVLELSLSALQSARDALESRGCTNQPADPDGRCCMTCDALWQVNAVLYRAYGHPNAPDREDTWT